MYSVREAAAKNFKELVDVFGVDWAKSNIMPRVLEFCNHQNYLLRGTTILCVNALAMVVGADVVDDTLLPLILKMADDTVPNIRLKAAGSLHLMSRYVEPTVKQARIQPALENLSSDSDKDVRFCAGNALKELGAPTSQ